MKVLEGIKILPKVKPCAFQVLSEPDKFHFMSKYHIHTIIDIDRHTNKWFDTSAPI